MDLDFSFALVSSLTPRRQAGSRTPLIEKNELSSKSLKTKKNHSTFTKSHCNNKYSEVKKDNKENHIPEEKLMNKNEHYKSNKSSQTKCNGVPDDNTDFSCFSVNMANVAVRKKRGRRKTKSNSLLSIDIQLNSIEKDKKIEIPILNNKNDLFCSISAQDGLLDIECSSVKNVQNENHEHLYRGSHIKKGVKRKSPQFYETVETSSFACNTSDFVESPNSEVNNILTKNSKSFDKGSILKKQTAKRNLRQSSGTSKTSISPAYDCDFFQATHRESDKFIPETMDSHSCLTSNLKEKRKSLIQNNTRKYKNGNDVDSNICTSEDKKKYLPCLSSNISKTTPPQNKELTKCISNVEVDKAFKKKLRSSNESSLDNKFKIESVIKSQSISVIQKEEYELKEKAHLTYDKKDKRKLSISPVLKEINKKELQCTKANSVKAKKIKSKEILHEKLKVEVEEENICKKPIKEKDSSKKNKQINSGKYLKNSPINVSSKKSTLLPPTEVIPKFEHINNWLKDTQEQSIISISSNSSLDSPNRNITKPKPKMLVSISPRIKRKMKIAKTTLEEEQKIFEELYGGQLATRLSDDVEEVLSIASSQESVELSEKVLDKIYGTFWQKKSVLPQSEPRKGRQKKSSKKNIPQTERKKQRTSIYDVFSSSSSEDRFEEFLESVRRGKDESKQQVNRPSTPDFINDSESNSNCSLTFYQNIVSSAVKEDLKNNKEKYQSLTHSPKVNRRRLSFSSSGKDDISVNDKISFKPPGKGKKDTIKDGKKRNPKSKKETDKDCNEKTDNSINSFTLVTPLKVKDKKANDKLDDRIRNAIDSEVPRSVGKAKTPKNDGISNTEEKLRRKYLGDGDFKVPTGFSALKTPTNSIKKDVPSSPALSFLSSLSEMTAGLPCHPDALIYKKCFKSNREELTKKLFCLYNREVFENKLPADMSIQWNTRMRSTSGYCYNKRTYSNNQILRSSRIVLSTKILDRADRLRDTLIHELCHAATWIVNATSDGHGPKWKAWADKANRRFPELPVIKRCHDYAISTKYTYKCISCGYCIGRHSKSLDTDRKRCGYCYGKFQVFVTSKMSTASATSGSDSVKVQRNPTGFALFVKENYATIKKENNVPHGQVMKLLSQKFAEVKISKTNANEPVIT